MSEGTVTVEPLQVVHHDPRDDLPQGTPLPEDHEVMVTLAYSVLAADLAGAIRRVTDNINHEAADLFPTSIAVQGRARQ